MPPSSAWMSASTIIMRPPMIQEITAAGPAAISPSCAPNSQPEPMIEPTEAHIRPIRPTSRLREVEWRAGFSAKDMRASNQDSNRDGQTGANIGPDKHAWRGGDDMSQVLPEQLPWWLA